MEREVRVGKVHAAVVGRFARDGERVKGRCSGWRPELHLLATGDDAEEVVEGVVVRARPGAVDAHREVYGRER